MGYFSQYNATPKTRVSGQPEIYQETDAQGNSKVTMGAALPGSDYEADAQRVITVPRASGVISTATTTTIDTGAGTIGEIRVIGGTLGNITIYDNTAASGTVLIPAVAGAVNLVVSKNRPYSTGVTIVTAAATIIEWSVG